jgi:hypothetical protein
MVLHGIDDALRMFHSHPERERLGFDVNFLPVKKIKDVAGGMTGGKDQCIGQDFQIAGCIFSDDSFYRAVLSDKIFDACVEMNFPPACRMV